MAAAARSIELDPTSSAGHNALACATLLFQNNHATAKQEFERALDLNPSYVLARCWYLLLYFQSSRGEFEQGIAEARRALDIDPLSAYVATNLAGCLCTADRLDEAIEMALGGHPNPAIEDHLKSGQWKTHNAAGSQGVSGQTCSWRGASITLRTTRAIGKRRR